jgi:hypothetical protein
MKNNRVNPVNIVHDYFTELCDKYTTTTDLQEKSVLHRRLRNLKSVLQFLASVQSCSKNMGDYA